MNHNSQNVVHVILCPLQTSAFVNRPIKKHVLSFFRMIGLPTGIIGFLLAKRQVDKNRLKQLKIRQRMKRSNEGEYEGTRYRHSAEDVKLDT